MTNEEAAKQISGLLKYFADEFNTFTDEEKEALHKAIAALRNQQEWIPCSERLPEDDEMMLVNYIEPRDGGVTMWIGWHEMENVWFIDGEAHGKEYGNEIIAWMPLPPAYRGGETE